MKRKSYRPFKLFEDALDAGRRWEDILMHMPYVKRWAIACSVIGLLSASLNVALILLFAPYLMFGVWWVTWPLIAFVIDLTIGHLWLTITERSSNGTDND